MKVWLLFSIIAHSFVLNSSKPNSLKVTFQDPLDEKYLLRRPSPTPKKLYLEYLELCRAWSIIKETCYQYSCQNADETAVWQSLQEEDLSIDHLYPLFLTSCPTDKIDFVTRYYKTIRKLCFILNQKKDDHLAQCKLNTARMQIRIAIRKEEENQRAEIQALFLTENKS